MSEHADVNNIKPTMTQSKVGRSSGWWGKWKNVFSVRHWKTKICWYRRDKCHHDTSVVTPCKSLADDPSFATDYTYHRLDHSAARHRIAVRPQQRRKRGSNATHPRPKHTVDNIESDSSKTENEYSDLALDLGSRSPSQSSAEHRSSSATESTEIRPSTVNSNVTFRKTSPVSMVTEGQGNQHQVRTPCLEART